MIRTGLSNDFGFSSFGILPQSSGRVLKQFSFAHVLPCEDKKTVSAYFTSKQIRHFGFAEQCSRQEKKRGCSEGCRVIQQHSFLVGCLSHEAAGMCQFEVTIRPCGSINGPITADDGRLFINKRD